MCETLSNVCETLSDLWWWRRRLSRSTRRLALLLADTVDGLFFVAAGHQSASPFVGQATRGEALALGWREWGRPTSAFHRCA